MAGETEEYAGRQSATYVVRLLAQEPVEVQRAAIAILSMLKNIAKSMTEE